MPPAETQERVTLPHYAAAFPFLFHHITSRIRPTRTLVSILNTDDSILEIDHSSIQLLFPLPEPCPINPSAPLIDRHIFEDFRSSAPLRKQLLVAFDRMLQFYGLARKIAVLPLHVVPQGPPIGPPGSNIRYDDSQYIIAPSHEDFETRSPVWVMNYCHHHLRIARIIRSLRILGCQPEAEAFFRAVKKVAEETGQIGAPSVEFWRRAARRKLHVPPENEFDDFEGGVGGEAWLRGLDDLVGDELGEKFIIYRWGPNGDRRGGVYSALRDGGGGQGC